MILVWLWALGFRRIERALTVTSRKIRYVESSSFLLWSFYFMTDYYILSWIIMIKLIATRVTSYYPSHRHHTGLLTHSDVMQGTRPGLIVKKASSDNLSPGHPHIVRLRDRASPPWPILEIDTRSTLMTTTLSQANRSRGGSETNDYLCMTVWLSDNARQMADSFNWCPDRSGNECRVWCRNDRHEQSSSTSQQSEVLIDSPTGAGCTYI